VRAGSLPLERSAERFDLVVANISFRVLRDLRHELKGALAPRGAALLSGLLERDAPALIDELQMAGWRLLEERCEAEWSLLVVSTDRE